MARDCPPHLSYYDPALCPMAPATARRDPRLRGMGLAAAAVLACGITGYGAAVEWYVGPTARVLKSQAVGQGPAMWAQDAGKPAARAKASATRDSAKQSAKGAETKNPKRKPPPLMEEDDDFADFPDVGPDTTPTSSWSMATSSGATPWPPRRFDAILAKLLDGQPLTEVELARTGETIQLGASLIEQDRELMETQMEKDRELMKKDRELMETRMEKDRELMETRMEKDRELMETRMEKERTDQEWWAMTLKNQRDLQRLKKKKLEEEILQLKEDVARTEATYVTRVFLELAMNNYRGMWKMSPKLGTGKLLQAFIEHEVLHPNGTVPADLMKALGAVLGTWFNAKDLTNPDAGAALFRSLSQPHHYADAPPGMYVQIKGDDPGRLAALIAVLLRVQKPGDPRTPCPTRGRLGVFRGNRVLCFLEGGEVTLNRDTAVDG